MIRNDDIFFFRFFITQPKHKIHKHETKENDVGKKLNKNIKYKIFRFFFAIENQHF